MVLFTPDPQPPGVPFGAETSGGYSLSLVTPGQGVSRTDVRVCTQLTIQFTVFAVPQQEEEAITFTGNHSGASDTAHPSTEWPLLKGNIFICSQAFIRSQAFSGGRRRRRSAHSFGKREVEECTATW